MSENKTMENLMAAFAGESQANRKYTAYAKKAEKDGKTNAAKLFRAAADAETIHALKHFEGRQCAFYRRKPERRRSRNLRIQRHVSGLCKRSRSRR